MIRHNTVSDEWHHLCAQALTPAAVSDEPLIHTSQDRPTGPATQATPLEPDLRGNVAAHGFWHRGTTAIFDIRITDAEAPSQRGTAHHKILKRHEETKKAKYNEACLRRRRSFTPLVFTVDGLRGNEAIAASKKLASRLSSKWNRTYSEVCGYVRSRLSLALARAASHCLRADRDPIARTFHTPWESGTGLSLYHH